MTKITIIPDSNIFLHYRLIDEIEWEKIFPGKIISVVILPSVLREINHKKDSTPKNKITQRAQDSIKKIKAILQSDSPYCRVGVPLILSDREYDHDWQTLGLAQSSPDDRIIAESIALRDENDDTEIVIVTSDVGMLLTAKSIRHNIKSFELPDQYKIPAEPTEEDRKIRELTAELQKIKNRLPNINISFGDMGSIFNWHCTEMDQSKIDEIEQEAFQKIANANPIRNKRNELTKTALGAMMQKAPFLMDLASPSEEDVASYNAEIIEYKKEVEKIKDAKIESYRESLLRFEFQLIIQNIGTARATNLRIHLHFPDGFVLGELDELSSPAWPQMPQKPVSRMESAMRPIDSISRFRFPPPATHQMQHTLGNVFGGSIRKSNSYDLNVSIQEIGHQETIDIFDIYCQFQNIEMASSFSASWDVLCDEIPNAVSGVIHFNITK